MAPREQPPSRPTDEEDNPFVAFRRFADEQMSSILHNLVGLPSTLETPAHGRWTTYDEWVRRSMGDWSGIGATPSDPPPPTNHQQQQQQQQPITRCPYRPASTTPAPRSALDGNDPASAWRTWLRRYLLLSPYSPRHLEDDEAELARRRPWARAFEDLLAAQAGLELPPQPQGAEQDAPRADCRWALDMAEDYAAHPPQEWQQQRIPLPLPPRDLFDELARSFGLASVAPESDAQDNGGEEARSELDLYERFLGKTAGWGQAQGGAEVAATSSVSSTSHDPAGAVNRESEARGVVPTMTTTEKVTMPDGTTTTKVVLRKRFADGREESSETTHTTQGWAGGSEALKQLAERKGQNVTESKDGERKEKKGWFWS